MIADTYLHDLNFEPYCIKTHHGVNKYFKKENISIWHFAKADKFVYHKVTCFMVRSTGCLEKCSKIVILLIVCSGKSDLSFNINTKPQSLSLLSFSEFIRRGKNKVTLVFEVPYSREDY